MSQCPKCGAGLKEDYGMVTCPKCGAILFVDMDGNAHVGDDPDPVPAIEDGSAVSSMVDTQTTPHEISISAEPAPFDYVNNDLNFEPMSDELADPGLEVGPGATYPDEPTNFNPADHANPTATDHADFGADGHGMLSEEDPLGLNAFANSELSAAKDGMLMCRLHISGVDTREIREALRASMSDARFNWNPIEILSHLKRGHLTMDNVTPVKATILINRIKQLPLRIRWEQYTIAQADDENRLDGAVE